MKLNKYISFFLASILITNAMYASQADQKQCNEHQKALEKLEDYPRYIHALIDAIKVTGAPMPLKKLIVRYSLESDLVPFRTFSTPQPFLNRYIFSATGYAPVIDIWFTGINEQLFSIDKRVRLILADGSSMSWDLENGKHTSNAPKYSIKLTGYDQPIKEKITAHSSERLFEAELTTNRPENDGYDRAAEPSEKHTVTVRVNLVKFAPIILATIPEK